MFSPRHFLGSALVGAAALAGGAVQATVIYTNTLSLSAADPTQLGRLSRNGVLQDWAGGESFPGTINLTSAYHYRTWDLDLGALEAGYSFGQYIQVTFDSTAATTFISAYLNAYVPTSLSTNWLGDPGLSGNNLGTDPLFFQVIAGSGSHLILVMNESVANGGLSLPGEVTVEAFSDTLYTDLGSPVPETATWALTLAGIGVLQLLRRKPA